MNWWWWWQQHRWSPSCSDGHGSHQQCFCTQTPQLLTLLPNIIEVLSLYQKQPDGPTVAAPETGPFWKCLRFFKREEEEKAVCRKQVSKMGSKQGVGVNFVCRQLSKIESSQSKVFLFRLIILWICTMSIKSLTCKQQSCRVYWNGLEFMYFLVKYMCWSDQNKVDW